MNERQNSEEVKQSLVSKPQLLGVAELAKFIERVGFGKLQTQQLIGPFEGINLVLHLDSPIPLKQLLNYYAAPGTNRLDTYIECQSIFSSLINHLDSLAIQNGEVTDIEEFTLSFADCQLVLQRTRSRSVSDIWLHTFCLLEKHFESLSHEVLGFPSEIFPTVYGYSDDGSTEIDNLPHSGYWSLYYECDDRAWIYDLATRTLQVEEVQFLNTSN